MYKSLLKPHDDYYNSIPLPEFFTIFTVFTEQKESACQQGRIENVLVTQPNTPILKCLQHLRMGTATMKEDKKQKEKEGNHK